MQTRDAALDSELIERVLAGDDGAFGLLVERYQGVVFNIAYRLLGEREEARDVAQEAFWRAYRGLASFDRGRPLAPWLCRITTNLSLNWLRRPRPPVISLDARLDGEGGHPALDPLDPGAGPSERLMQTEAQAQIRQAILALAPADRAAIELRHYQGLSYEEIAHEMGTSLSSVKSRLFRARQQLQARLAIHRR